MTPYSKVASQYGSTHLGQAMDGEPQEHVLAVRKAIEIQTFELQRLAAILVNYCMDMSKNVWFVGILNYH